MKKNVGISYKAFAVILVAVLVLGGTIGGTMAWLIDEHDPVTNTFTESDISISLDETERTYPMVPGHTIDKDPKITVSANSEDCYVFVEVKESENYDNYLVYAIADGWQSLENTPGVYYRTVSKAANAQTFSILKGSEYTSSEGTFTWTDNQVLVKPEVTKADMQAAENSQPTLTFTAYAVQLNKNNTETFSPADAWEKATAIATSDN